MGCTAGREPERHVRRRLELQSIARGLGGPAGREHGRHVLPCCRLRPPGERAVVHVIGLRETGEAAAESGARGGAVFSKTHSSLALSSIRVQDCASHSNLDCWSVATALIAKKPLNLHCHPHTVQTHSHPHSAPRRLVRRLTSRRSSWDPYTAGSPDGAPTTAATGTAATAGRDSHVSSTCHGSNERHGPPKPLSTDATTLITAPLQSNTKLSLHSVTHTTAPQPCPRGRLTPQPRPRPPPWPS